ncbi:MAG: oligosaccharide flippase family protein [Pseudomonadota bacterium]
MAHSGARSIMAKARAALRNAVPAGGMRSDAIGSAVTKLVHAVLAMAVAVVLARVLGPADFGHFAFAMACASIMTIVVQIGLPGLVLRETARAVATGAPMPGHLVVWSLAVGSGVSAAVGICIALALWQVPEVMPGPGRAPLMAILLLVPLVAALSTINHGIMGGGRVALGLAMDAVMRSGLFLMAIAGALLLTGTLSPLVAVVLNIAVTGATLAVALAVAWRRGLFEGALTRTRDVRTWLAVALPLGALGGINVINSNTDLVMLGILASEADVGRYRVVGQVVLVVLLVPDAIMLAVRPRFAGLWQTSDKATLRGLVRRVAIVSTVATIAVASPFVIAGDVVLEAVFGEGFAAGATALSILGIAAVLSSALGPSVSLASMAGQERVAMQVVGVSALLNIALNAAFIPYFGIEGAATASALSLVFSRLWMRRVVRRRLGVECCPAFT